LGSLRLLNTRDLFEFQYTRLRVICAMRAALRRVAGE
jgi:hypothetical protein